MKLGNHLMRTASEAGAEIEAAHQLGRHVIRDTRLIRLNTALVDHLHTPLTATVHASLPLTHNCLHIVSYMAYLSGVSKPPSSGQWARPVVAGKRLIILTKSGDKVVTPKIVYKLPNRF